MPRLVLILLCLELYRMVGAIISGIISDVDRMALYALLVNLGFIISEVRNAAA